MKQLVDVFQRRHANLDSFPLRYGFSFPEDTIMELTYEQATLKADNKSKKRYSIIADFTNPKTKIIEHGLFYIVNKFTEGSRNEVVTVIRHLNNIKTEYHLSEVIRSLRESGVISVSELILMHPLYLDGKIKKHADLLNYLAKKRNSKDAEKIQSLADEALIKLENANRQIGELEEKNTELEEELKQKKKEVQKKDKLIEELRQIVNSRNEEVKKTGPVKRSNEFPDLNWNENTVTSAIFEDWCEIGDFLCVYLMGKDKPIRLKNTFIYDYPEALKVVKTIKPGYVIDYVTKGSGIFPTDEWFSKIIKIENPLSDVYSNEEWEDMEEILNEPMPDFPERGTKIIGRDGSIYESINSSDNPYRIFRALFERYAQRLRKQSNISESSFYIIGVYLAPAPLFVEYFGHIWYKPMIVLETDKGWFVDTTAKEHGGTYWKEHETYHNCRVSMTKGKYLPYWLQK